MQFNLFMERGRGVKITGSPKMMISHLFRTGNTFQRSRSSFDTMKGTTYKD